MTCLTYIDNNITVDNMTSWQVRTSKAIGIDLVVHEYSPLNGRTVDLRVKTVPTQNETKTLFS